jgi:hypothetical protein
MWLKRFEDSKINSDSRYATSHRQVKCGERLQNRAGIAKAGMTSHTAGLTRTKDAAPYG